LIQVFILNDLKGFDMLIIQSTPSPLTPTGLPERQPRVAGLLSTGEELPRSHGLIGMACICGLKAFGPTLDFFGKSKMLMKLRTTTTKRTRG
jgi:hypothetical protein